MVSTRVSKWCEMDFATTHSRGVSLPHLVHPGFLYAGRGVHKAGGLPGAAHAKLQLSPHLEPLAQNPGIDEG